MTVPPAEVAEGRAGATPIGIGLASIIPAQASRDETAARPADPPEVPRQPGYQSQPPPLGQTGQDVVVGFDARLGAHPELGENGVPLPRARRSVVAEAHKRALERREAERALANERRAVFGSRPVTGARPRPAPEPPAAEPTTAPPPAEPEVRMAERPTTPEREQRPPSPPVSEEATVQTFRPAGTPLVPAETPRPQAPPPPATDAPTQPATPATGGARYWDEPATSSRFNRMRPAPSEPAAERPAPARAVQQVGRERSSPPPERPTRTIRPLAPEPTSEGAPRENRPAFPRTGVAPAEAVREERPQSPRGGRPAEQAAGAERTQFPRPGRSQPPPAPGPAPEMLPPRQVDEALLRRLEADWRQQELQAHPGQRCGTCRYFRPGEGGERGACGCQFAGTYRQTVATQDLGCLGPLGTWWAATDDGWLQKTEPRRPRRATPLLDTLERELSERERAALYAEPARRQNRR